MKQQFIDAVREAADDKIADRVRNRGREIQIPVSAPNAGSLVWDLAGWSVSRREGHRKDSDTSGPDGGQRATLEELRSAILEQLGRGNPFCCSCWRGVCTARNRPLEALAGELDRSFEPVGQGAKGR